MIYFFSVYWLKQVVFILLNLVHSKSVVSSGPLIHVDIPLDYVSAATN